MFFAEIGGCVSQGKWVGGNSYTRDIPLRSETSPSALTLQSTVKFNVNIHAKNGPVMEGAAITNGSDLYFK